MAIQSKFKAEGKIILTTFANPRSRSEPGEQIEVLAQQESEHSGDSEADRTKADDTEGKRDEPGLHQPADAGQNCSYSDFGRFELQRFVGHQEINRFEPKLIIVEAFKDPDRDSLDGLTRNQIAQ